MGFENVRWKCSPVVFKMLIYSSPSPHKVTIRVPLLSASPCYLFSFRESSSLTNINFYCFTNRGGCMWTTCLRSLHDSVSWLGIKPVTSISPVNRHTYCYTPPHIFSGPVLGKDQLWYAGKPKAGGSKSSRDESISVGCGKESSNFRSVSRQLGSGTQTTCIPAASAPSTPFGASSNTRTCSRTSQTVFLHRLFTERLLNLL